MTPFTWHGRAALSLCVLLVACNQNIGPGNTSKKDSGIAADAGPDGGSPADAGPQDGGILTGDGGQVGTCGTPTILSVTPPHGPATGGTEVVLEGQCFANGFAGNQAGIAAVNLTTISFGTNSVDPSTMTIVDDTTMTLAVPPGFTGPADITLTNPNGQTVCSGCYTYLTPITITGIASPVPPKGPTLGGTPFTLSGSGFATGQLVLVGGADALNVSASVDGTTISGVTPPGVAGAADIQVVSAETSGLLSRAWNYVAPISIASVAPTWSTQAGGVTVTITGSGFTPDDQVSFGTNSATTTWVSGTQLTVVVPPSTTAGAVDVTVVSTSGQQATLTNGFSYVPSSCASLQLYSIAPQQGPISGGTCASGTGCVEVIGCGFAEGMQLFFGPNLANISVTSGNVVEADLPAASTVGVVDVNARLISGGNQYSASLSQAFAYVSPLTVTGISPNSGPSSGQPVTTAIIAGAGLSASCQVTVGGTVAAVQSAAGDGTSLVVNVPPGPEGAADVAVACGTAGTVAYQQATLVGGYTYEQPLNLLYVTPDTGSIAGNTFVSLYGDGFPVGGHPAVTFGGSSATNVQVLSPHLITANTPPGNAGFVDVKVTSGGQSSTLVGAFGYYNPKNSLGGSSGGAMNGTLNVSILNSSYENYGAPIPGVTVSINNDDLIGATDSRGEVTFSGSSILLKPVNITASLAGSTTVSMENVNARDVTLYMLIPPTGSPGGGGGQPTSPATFEGTVCGFKLPASATVGPGSSVVAQVYFADPNVYSSVPFAQPGTPYTVIQDCGTWKLQTYNFGPHAIWAQVGVREQSGAFTPYLMTVQRGLDAQPGVTVDSIPLVMSMHLDQNVPIEVQIAHTTQTIQNNVYAYLDLGGEGVVPLGKTAAETNDFTFTGFPDVAGTSVIFLDESYGVDVHGNMTYPVAFKYAEDDGDVATGVVIGPMPAFPQVVSPVNGGAFSGTLTWNFGSGPLPNVQQLALYDDGAGTEIWSAILPGTQRTLSLPASALTTTLPMTNGTTDTLSWTLITSDATQFDYNNMNFQQLGLNAWTGWTESFGIMTYTSP